jgi:hypothetical protein
MGGKPLTETDDKGNTRFYPVLVQSDGTQCPVSAEYLRAMGIEWPPPAPVHIQHDMEAIASELYQRAVANARPQPQEPPANRSTYTSAGPAASGIGGSRSREDVEAMAAAALAQTNAGLLGVTTGGVIKGLSDADAM